MKCLFIVGAISHFVTCFIVSLERKTDIYRNYKNDWDWETEPNEDIGDSATLQPADMAVDPGMADPGMADPGIDPSLPADAAPAEPPAAGGTA